MDAQYYMTYETNNGDGPIKRPTVPGDWRVKSIAATTTTTGHYGSPITVVLWENDQTR
jgi:hypothetical protein